MPYRSVKQARDDVPALESLSDKQVRHFIKVFNSLVSENTPEGQVIPIAISQAKKVEKDKHEEDELVRESSFTLTGKKKGVDKNKNAMMHILQGMLAMLGSKEGDEYEEYYSEREDSDDLEYAYEEDILKDQKESHTCSIVKQFQDEEMIAVEPLYINVGDVDAHEDGITDEQLDKLIDNFNENIENIMGNIHHAYMTEGFKPLKAYRMPMTVYIGDPQKASDMKMITKGQPVVEVQFLDKILWEKRKSGILGGVSIGAKGKRVKNPHYKGEI